MRPGVDGVLLAGGSSRRAGGFKMEAELAGKPLLLWSLDALAAACARVIVVGGWQADKIAGLVAGRDGVEVVINASFAAGMLSSVQAGVACVRAPRFFVLPGDMPLVKAQTFTKLLDCDADIVVPAWRGRRGHPVLICSRLLPGILAEPPGSSLNAFIRRRGGTTVEVDDPGILADLDSREDIAKADVLLREEGRP